jgi:hypothetical protein
MNPVRPIKICLNETYSKIHIGEHLSNVYSVMNGLMQGMLYHQFALEYAIRKVRGNRVSGIEWDISACGLC